MDRYYFHVRRGRVTFLDSEGIELADLNEAAKEAARRAWEIKARERTTDLPASIGRVVVDNEFRTVLELPFDTVHKDGLASPATGDLVVR